MNSEGLGKRCDQHETAEQKVAEECEKCKAAREAQKPKGGLGFGQDGLGFGHVGFGWNR